jgi:hypothetical protein
MVKGAIDTVTQPALIGRMEVPVAVSRLVSS